MEEKQRAEIIQYLVDKLQQSGKVKLQKTVYFLQEALGVPLDYDYEMHYYGPYSFGLDDTLSEMRGKGILHIAPFFHASGYGYEISLGKNAESNLKLLSEYKDKADKVVDIFKLMDAQTTELWATIHFVHSILNEQGKDSSKEIVVKEVNLLKPKFSEGDIGKTYDEIRNKSML